jgi:hypothetical protein
MKYEITHDEAFIHRCLTDPVLWRLGKDDALAGVNPRLFFAPVDGSVLYVKAGEYGLLIGRPVNCISLDVHIALLQEAKGKAVDICKGAINWVFENSQKPLRITASIPEYNKLAIRLAQKVGMEFIGVNRKSFLREGVLYDQHLFGISEEDVCRKQ